VKSSSFRAVQEKVQGKNSSLKPVQGKSSRFRAVQERSSRLGQFKGRVQKRAEK
jgi:hypothetical protein